MSYYPPPQHEPWRNSPYRPNGFAIASLCLGIAAILFCLVPIVGLVCGVLAVIFGFVGLNRFKRFPNIGGRGLTIWGTVLGCVGIAASIAFWAFFVYAVVNTDPSVILTPAP